MLFKFNHIINVKELACMVSSSNLHLGYFYMVHSLFLLTDLLKYYSTMCTDVVKLVSGTKINYF